MSKKKTPAGNLGIVLIAIGAVLLGFGCLCSAGEPVFAPALFARLIGIAGPGIAGRAGMIALRIVVCGPAVLGAALLLGGVVMMVATRRPKAAPEPVPSPPAKPAVKACPSCGAENPPENAFCEQCGTTLE